MEVGRFRLTRLLGKGGMGRVYLGVHPSIGSRVAIKVLAEDCADQPELLERFFTEARAVNLIQHENIAAITDLDRLPNGRPFIVMEYIEGRTVRELVERGPAPLGAIVEIMRDVLVALDAAHQVEIIHRDLKPDNVIVTALGRAKVLDFGIAKLVERSTVRTATGAAIGTPHYMAPEQIRGGVSDARTDVYAAGVMLFELVTGHRPYDGDSDFALMEAHLRAPIPSAGAAPAIEAVIRRALAKDPEARFPSAQAMADALVEAGDTLDEALLAKFESSVLRPRQSAPTLKSPVTAATKADASGASPRSSDAATVDGTGPRPPAPESRRSVTVTPPATPTVTNRTPRWMMLALVALTLVAAAAIGLALSKREVVRVVEVPQPAADATVVAQVLVDAAVGSDVVDAAIVADAGAPLVAATAPTGKPRPPRSLMPTHTCESWSDCPNYSCGCNRAWMRNIGCDARGICTKPEAACPSACKDQGGWRGVISVSRPLVSADCAGTEACKQNGHCTARMSPDDGLTCVKSCADTSWCRYKGLCVDQGVSACGASAESCANSEDCANYGICGVRDGVCVVNAEGCLKQARCIESGDCGPSADGASCVPRAAADCKSSRLCAAGGYCTFSGDDCVPADTAACAAAPACASHGYCTLKKKTCVVTLESCQASQICKDEGYCAVSDYRNECAKK